MTNESTQYITRTSLSHVLFWTFLSNTSPPHFKLHIIIGRNVKKSIISKRSTNCREKLQLMKDEISCLYFIICTIIFKSLLSFITMNLKHWSLIVPGINCISLQIALSVLIYFPSLQRVFTLLIGPLRAWLLCYMNANR